MKCSPKTPSGGGQPRKRYVAHVLRSALKSLLGDAGLRVLEYHLEKRLGGRDVYEVFYEEPNRFYEAMKGFLGEGVDGILRILGSKLMEDGYLNASSPEEFAEALGTPGEEAGRRLRKMFKLEEGCKP